MEIKYSKDFVKHFQKRIPQNSSLEKKFQERLNLFLNDKTNPLLKDHQLVGQKRNFRSFSVTGNVRVIYSPEPDGSVVFVDIGTHNQVYNKSY